MFRFNQRWLGLKRWFIGPLGSSLVLGGRSVQGVVLTLFVFQTPSSRGTCPVKMSYGGAERSRPASRDVQSLIQTCSSNIQTITHNSTSTGPSCCHGNRLAGQRHIGPMMSGCWRSRVSLSPDSCSDQEYGEPAGNQAGQQSSSGQPVRRHVPHRASGRSLHSVLEGHLVLMCAMFSGLSLCPVHRQQIQHSTNQLAKDTNKHLKDLGAFPLPSSPSEQVRVFYL